MKLILKLKYLLLLPIGFFIYAGYVSYLKYPKEMKEIYLNDAGGKRKFNIYSEYLQDPNDPQVRNFIMIKTSFPDMSPQGRWSGFSKDVNLEMILIRSSDGSTSAESTIKFWNLLKDRKDNSFGFERYIGTQDGYEVYESLPSPKTGEKRRTLIFYDEHNNAVSDDGRHGSARMLSGLIIRYGSAKSKGISPKEMHAWTKVFLDKLKNEELKGENK